MEENGTKINPEDVRISDIGRALLNLPRAIYRKFKEKRQVWKATKEEQLAAKKARKEAKKAKRAEKRKNNFFRRTIANILNTNPKEVDRIKKRNEEETTCLNEDPVTPTADTPVPEQQSPTNDGKKSDSGINLDVRWFVYYGCIIYFSLANYSFLTGKKSFYGWIGCWPLVAGVRLMTNRAVGMASSVP